jgi:competence protein ComEA
MRLVSRLSISFGLLCGGVAALGQELPNVPGKAETEKVCKGCHEVARSVSLRQDRDAWAATVQKMVALGAKGTPEEISAVVDFLAKHYPAEDAPRLRVNEARAIDFESILGLRRSQAAALVKHRDSIGGFKSIDDLKNAPGVDAAKIDAVKDRLAF